MASNNKCIWVDANGKLSIRPVIEEYEPSGGQALVKVAYSAINPADLAHARALGFNNSVCGYEFCGTVVATGQTSRYAVGDVVFGSNEPGPRRPPFYGAHQDFLITESNSLSMRLDNKDVSHPDAAAMSIMVRTAADALLNHFGLRLPAGEQNPNLGHPGALVIWGGASAVGTAAIQLARALNIDSIFVTASPRNFEALQRIGASLCFDYRDEHVVANIQTALEQSAVPLTMVFDTVCKGGRINTIKQCESLSTSANIQFACTLPQPGNPRWNMVLASRANDFPFPPPLPPRKASPKCEARLEEAVSWAVHNYGAGFVVPKVTVVEGGHAGLAAIHDVFEGRNSFQKVVIKTPI
ncbi:uncharacterized protein N0V89_004898 [Didymosphaeria variabile]|uniref:Enoyl reductase (ER) domain-containing protein n=1 Tax=Didymosphaeria variabile TaxID=1932322 RepID=A0A9W9CE02_9PLEO|nr:uncharacterized protein N0V89_004898 [Didymosphaeria variabile]KAJ4356861.1 hypothetical protein N0V89_004898 [Didymosphaeria variabile]